MIRYSVFCFLFFLGVLQARAQSQADFTVTPNQCREQLTELDNLSLNVNTFQWDFCLEDFKHLAKNTLLPTVQGISGGAGYKLVEDQNGNWFAFVTGQFSNTIHRLAFGNSPVNTPTVTSLGNPGGLLKQPLGIEIVNQDGIWVGFVGAVQADEGIIKLDFGGSLENIPTAQNIGVFGISGGRFWDIRVVKQNNDWILMTVNRDANSILRVNYRNSFSNIIIPSSHVYDTGPVPGANLPLGLDVIYTGSKWVVVLPSYFNNSLQQLNFGNDLLGSFTLEGTYIFHSLKRPYSLRIVREGNFFVAFVNNESDAISIINMKDLDPANTPEDVAGSNLPTFRDSAVARWKGRTICQGTYNGNSDIRNLTFHNACGASFEFSEIQNPQNLFYSISGTKYIELMATNSGSLETFYAMKKTTVASMTSPDIGFNSQNICVQNDINFTTQNVSGNINTYTWDFGDNQTSAQSSPSHRYSVAGNYFVNLSVTADNGCINSISKQLKVYPSPEVNFTLPASGTTCTNQEYEFVNSSIYDETLEPAWQWQIDNVNQSVAKDGSFAFPAATDYEVKLTASIPGCSTSLTQNFNVQAVGPSVDFTMTGVCQNEPVEFASDITGQFTSLQWNFGDGTNSSLEDPTHNYATIGNYNVLLTAVSASGCQNSAEKTITIYSKPQPNFSLDLPPFSCAGSLSQFNDLTPSLTDSNIATWTWHFGDAANGTSPHKNPTYIYTLAGDYQVSLETETNFGCTNTIQKPITISQAPLVDFTHDASCLNQGTQFHDASGSNVKAWLWTIQNNTYTSQNPSHSFNSTGDQSATLAVTGNNNCVSQVSKTLFIPTPVNIDFTAQSTCASKPSFFQETSLMGTDPATSWRWDFGGQQALGSPAQHVFQNTGNYNVRLYSTRQSGCVYSVSKSISVVAPPVAHFSMSPESGAAPLAVGFTNTSSGASSFLWKFNDANNSTSTLFSPSFTYSALGEYPVDLIARNANGCADTLQKIVQVVVPQINLAMTELTLFNNGDGSLRANVTIRNDGNLTIQNPDVYLNLAGKAQVKEKISGPVLPGQSITRTLATSILPTNLKYACAEVFVNGDTNQFDNEKCINLVDETVFISPYPNPANEIVYLEWVNTNLESLDLVIYNSLGQPVLSKTYSGLLTGLNQVELYVGNLAEGIYFATYITGNRTFSTRFSIVR